ncbi:hypothetical protein N0V94_008299 [Neodidymelliopsis sp. IMI 364377]|nr:hypothetical protein N0V94_008299 [Neodidymelliopsis sp. IMI 364377]
MAAVTVPLIIHGEDVTVSVTNKPAPFFMPYPEKNDTSLLRGKSNEVQQLIEQEISCSKVWAEINVLDAIGIAEDVASTVTSGILSGVSPDIRDGDAQALVLKEPLGVVLGIAPWNAPLILGLRAVAAAVAAGNTAILKGSEMSPRVHYLIAKLFLEAGFPPGVVNYIQHSPGDASECFEAIISNNDVRKCNFTGSTNVGRHIAKTAASYLKPVLLELGGKNFAIVLEDADLEEAADQVLLGAFLNVCGPTLDNAEHVTTVINARSGSHIETLLSGARAAGAKLTTRRTGPSGNAHLVEDVTAKMDLWTVESFGPVLGVRVFGHNEDPVTMVNESSYGLSGAIFSRNHLKALRMAKAINTGAVHINSATVHDDPGLPHGGWKESGWGRFGGRWGFEEFLQTKTIILHP